MGMQGAFGFQQLVGAVSQETLWVALPGFQHWQVSIAITGCHARAWTPGFRDRQRQLVSSSSHIS